MASNSEWVPLPPRQKKDKKQKEAHTKVLDQLKEMFGSNFEAEIISTVAEHSNWNLEQAIDTLITLSSSDQKPEEDAEQNVSDPWLADEFPAGEYQEDSPEASQADAWTTDKKKSSHRQQEEDEDEEEDEELNLPSRKVETASLCGLKVQYRPKGMENNSDDDADVVIEDEASDYIVETPEPDRINVCHFLSTPTQCPPKVTFPKLDCITTPSPPQSPIRQPAQRNNNQDKSSVQLSRIETDIQRGYKIMILMRGVPGSGKSYLARSIVAKWANGNIAAHIFSSDDYFSHVNGGVYVFDGTRLSDAHSYNQNRVHKALRDGVSPIFIDNTNTQAWEMKTYALMAVDYGYIIETLEANTPWSQNVHELELRNQHNVPRANIRRMLERYEPSISGDRLMRMFNIRYSPKNRPPQMRRIPPPPPPPAAAQVSPRKRAVPPKSDKSPMEQKMHQEKLNQQTLALQRMLTGLSMNNQVTIVPKGNDSPGGSSSSSNKASPRRRTRKARDNPWSAVEQQRNNITVQKIENNALSTIAKEYANLEEFIKDTNSVNNGGRETNDSWIAGTSYREDNQLDRTKLLFGAIGSERRYGPGSFDGEDDEDVKAETADELREQSSCSPTPRKAIGCERKNSVHALDDGEAAVARKAASDASKDNVLSQCWDFTMLLNGTQVHSKLDEADEQREKTDSSEKLESDVAEQSNDAAAAAVVSDPSTPSDSASNNSSDFERVSDTEQQQQPKEQSNAEKQSSVGLGSFLNFIKNSLYGAEKENVVEPPCEKKPDEVDSSSTSDRLTDKLRNTSSNPNDSSCEFSSSSADSEDNDTLSSKLSLVKINNTTESNLKCEPQGNVDISDDVIVMDAADSIRSSNDSIAETKDDTEEFFEAQELVDVNLQAKEDVANVIEELREACTDLTLVESLDFEEERTENPIEKTENPIEETEESQPPVDREEDMVVDDITSEKEFIDQILSKNLNEHAQSDDDEMKVLKEPIDNIFGNKNKLYRNKLERSSSPLESSGSASDSNGNTLINNINLVSWSPTFIPDDNKNLPIEPIIIIADREEELEMCHQETYTDPYDFNVAYMGGVDGYRVIEARDRESIELDQAIAQVYHAHAQTPSPKKLMLHKGTMTNATSVFQAESLVELENTDDEDRSNELVERYEILPRDCVLDVYKNLCKGDFNWTVDYLNNLLQEDEIYEALDKMQIQTPEEKPVNVDESDKKVPAKKRASSSESSASTEVDSPQRKPQRSRKDKFKSPAATQDALQLKRELEEKFVLSEESYNPHILRVKRWKNRDFSPKGHEAQMESADLIQFEEDKPTPEPQEPKKLTRLDHPAVVEEQQSEEDDSMEDEPEETIELKLGYEFIQVLENEFGNSNFQVPDGLFPVIQIRKSLAQELHALWIESMQQQLWVMQEQLDAMIAKDAEYAKTLEAEEEHEEEEARALPESDAPNLKEIMDMEMAFAAYSNTKRKRKKETDNDVEHRVTKQTLTEMFPNCDREMMFAIYEAHGYNFDEAVKVIEENCSSKSTLTMADILKKRKNLMDELHKESKYQTSKHNELGTQALDQACGGAEYEEEEEFDEEEGEEEEHLSYQEALKSAHHARLEARRQLSLRNENYRKAADHFRKKNPEVASYYSDVAKLHIRNMETANSQAASAFLAAQAHILQAEDTLDLHFLHVAEAQQALTIFLDHQLEQMTDGSRKQIFIITGRGARSTNGQSKIKPAIAKELNRRNIRFTEVNPGMLKIVLRKK